MLTVGKAAKMFGLSRSALLYYDQIGILSPSGRGENGYRLYSDSDLEKLKLIVSFREAGVPLDEIQKHLQTSQAEISSMLLKRLNELNQEINHMKKQQNVIIRLLNENDLKAVRMNINRELWFKILKNAGINHETALTWHMDFETHSPELHRRFLQALGISEDEIETMIGGKQYE